MLCRIKCKKYNLKYNIEFWRQWNSMVGGWGRNVFNFFHLFSRVCLDENSIFGRVSAILQLLVGCNRGSCGWILQKYLHKKLSFHWVIPEKNHTSPTDGTLEILAGGGSRALKIQVGRGV